MVFKSQASAKPGLLAWTVGAYSRCCARKRPRSPTQSLLWCHTISCRTTRRSSSLACSGPCSPLEKVAGRPETREAFSAALPGRQESADGWRGIALALRGDLDFIVKSLGGPNYGSGEPCSLCAATAGNWMDLRVTAPWRQQNRIFQSSCSLFEDGGLNLGRLLPDWMHSKHLGSDAYLAGSVLTLLVYELMRPALS